MKSGILAFIAGVATALGISAIRSKRLNIRAAAGLATLDLNSAPAEAFSILGISPDQAERIVDNRPYRHKLELLERYVIGQADYDIIKNRISTDESHANDGVRVAS